MTEQNKKTQAGITANEKKAKNQMLSTFLKNKNVLFSQSA